MCTRGCMPVCVSVASFEKKRVVWATIREIYHILHYYFASHLLSLFALHAKKYIFVFAVFISYKLLTAKSI